MALNNDIGVGLKCIQYLLVAFNVLFMLSGVLLVLTSVMVAEPLAELTPLLQQQFMSPGLLLGGAGGAVIVVSCFGIWGAVRQSTALVTLFAFLLSVLLLLELGAGLMAFLMQDNLRSVLSQNIKDAMWAYGHDPETKSAIDRMQRGLQCCGAAGPEDWRSSEWGFPSSCCDGPEAVDEDMQCSVETSRRPGCILEMGNLIVRGSAFIASTAIVTAFTQFLGILFACTLGRSIRQQKTLRDMRRTQLRDNLLNQYSSLDTKPMPPMTITY